MESKGEKVYTTDVIVQSGEFLDKKKESSANNTADVAEKVAEGTQNNPFKAMGDKVSSEGLPF